jgi:hypothetical protein
MSESEIIISFLEKVNRERIKTLLETKKGRKKFLATLAHNFIDKVDHNYLKKINGNKDDIVKTVSKYFNKKKFNIISEYSELDNARLELNEALQIIVGFEMGTIIYCTDGSVMYYEGEDIKERYIISKCAI